MNPGVLMQMDKVHKGYLDLIKGEHDRKKSVMGLEGDIGFTDSISFLQNILAVAFRRNVKVLIL